MPIQRIGRKGMSVVGDATKDQDCGMGPSVDLSKFSKTGFHMVDGKFVPDDRSARERYESMRRAYEHGSYDGCTAAEMERYIEELRILAEREDSET